MYHIIKTAYVNTSLGFQLKNICLGKDGERIVYHADGYYYLNKNNVVSRRRYKD